MKLYQLADEYAQAERHLNELVEEGIIDDQHMLDTLEGLQGEIEGKVINVACYIKNLESTKDAIRMAEIQMQTRRKRIERQIKYLEGYLKNHMQQAKLNQVKSPLLVVSIKQNPVKVEITNESLIPEKYIRQVTETKVDKFKLRDDLKSGEIIPGAELTSDYRLEIK